MSDTPNIVLELVGGSEDGAIYANVYANPYYFQTGDGRVGSRFQVIPTLTFLQQCQHAGEANAPSFEDHYEVYEVVERRDEWDHVYLRATYLGRKSDVPLDTA